LNSYTSARVYIGLPNALSLNQAALDAAYAGINGANVDWVRITLPWNAVQATSTTTVAGFNWTAADLAVNRALAAGLKVQAVLKGPLPTGVTTVTAANFTPFVQAAAQRYRPGGVGIAVAGGFVAEYQVWDEPNVNTNWPAATNPAPVSAGGYVAVLKAAHAAIKSNHPGTVVLMAGLQACTTATTQVGRTRTTTRQDPVAYLNAMYLARVAGYFDVAAYHPLTLPTAQFPDPPAPSGVTMKQADAFWAALRAREPGKRVQWGRVGFVEGPTNGVGVVSEDQQAAYLDTIRWFAEDRRSWVTGLALESWRD
jgi:hypothetical protein